MSINYINSKHIPVYYPDINMQKQAYTQQVQQFQQQNFYQYPTQNPFAVFQNFNYGFYQPNITNEYITLNKSQTPNGETIHLFQLKNGQKVAIVPRKDKATIVKTFLDAGSLNETDSIRGISHCIEHCLFKGSSKLKDGDVFKMTGAMGASTNASTDYAITDYYIHAPYMSSANLAKTIEIQGDMVSNPLFDKNALESEKGPICSEISMINDDISTYAFDKVIRNLFQINSNSGNLVAGSIESVKGLTQNDLIQHHKTYYNPQDVYTVVVGDVDVNETINLIAKNFTIPASARSNVKKEILRPIQQPTRTDVISSKTNATNIVLAFAGPKTSDEKAFIINQMLGGYLSNFSTSNLKNNLEKMSSTYATTVQKVGLNDNDPYAIVGMIQTNPNDEQKALDYFYDAIQKLQTQELTDDEFISLKNNYLKSIELSTCSSTEICENIGKRLMDNALNNYGLQKEIARNITKQDIMNFARQFYDLNKISIVVTHPSEVTQEKIKQNFNTSKYRLNAQNNIGNISFGSKLDVNTNNVKEFKLNNNTHIILNNTNTNLCAYNWTINTPPIVPKNPNIPMILAHMFQKGTNYKNQTELEKFEEMNAIDTSVFVNGRKIVVQANCLPEQADKTLNLMNELMYNPNLTEHDFEEAKRYIKDVLKSSQKDAQENLLDRLYPGFFPTNYKMLKELDKVQYQDILDFYKQLLQNGSSIFVATAPFEKQPNMAQEIINAQSSQGIIFQNSARKVLPMFKPETETSIQIDTDNLNQAQIYKSYKFPMSGNIEDEAKFEMVNMILGGTPNSRLFMDMRDKQHLAYHVSSNIRSFENTGILTLLIQTTTDDKEQNVQSYDNVKKSLEGFNNHVHKIQTEYVTDEELQAAKNKMKQNLVGECQDLFTETMLLSTNAQEPYGIKRIDKYFQAIDKITKEDIMQAARFIFSHHSTTSILASEDTINSQLEYLKTQGNLYKLS